MNPSLEWPPPTITFLVKAFFLLWDDISLQDIFACSWFSCFSFYYLWIAVLGKVTECFLVVSLMFLNLKLSFSQNGYHPRLERPVYLNHSLWVGKMGVCLFWGSWKKWGQFSTVSMAWQVLTVKVCSSETHPNICHSNKNNNNTAIVVAIW